MADQQSTAGTPEHPERTIEREPARRTQRGSERLVSRRDPRKQRYDDLKLEKKLRRLTAQAISDYRMIEEGDRVMVCLSGGKDSYTLLDMLLRLQRNAPVAFELIAVNLDQKQPGFPEDVLPTYLEQLGVDYHVIEEDTYSTVQRLTPAGKTTCPVCSRLRRAILYRFAREIGATRLALGHHLDDAVETLLLNLFQGGRMKAMPPKLRSDDGQHIVIRPLYYVRERLIERWAAQRAYPIIPCNLCGSQENLMRRQLKGMLAEWDRTAPGRVENIARGLGRVTPSHLADANLFDFAGLERLGGRAAGVPELSLLDVTMESQSVGERAAAGGWYEAT